MISHDLNGLADYLSCVDPDDLTEDHLRRMAQVVRGLAATAREMERLTVPAEARAPVPVVRCDGDRVVSFFRRRREGAPGRAS